MRCERSCACPGKVGRTGGVRGEAGMGRRGAGRRPRIEEALSEEDIVERCDAPLPDRPIPNPTPKREDARSIGEYSLPTEGEEVAEAPNMDAKPLSEEPPGLW